MKPLLTITLVALTVAVSNAAQTIRETWENPPPSGLYPANQPVTNNISSVGFVATSPWISNPAEHNNNTIFSIRGSWFPEYWQYGLPPNYYPTPDDSTISGALCQDNAFHGSTGTPEPTLWTAGDWMVRALNPSAAINFNTNGEYFMAFHVSMGFDAAYASPPNYGSSPAASGAGGIGFADGATTNAHFVAVGVTGTNVFLGPADSTHPFGTEEVSQSAYISQGTLGQPGNPNSLIYDPNNDTNLLDSYGLSGGLVQTNFTGGPYYVNAYSTNRVLQCNSAGTGILILGHLVTHEGGDATMQVKFYNADDADAMDLTANTIAWDASYSFNYTNTMSNMLVFENGQFPLFIYDFRVGTTLADVIGMDSEIVATPKADIYANNPFYLTNYVGLATADNTYNQNPALSGIADYGTITYQWQKNSTNIIDATNNYYSVANATPDDAGTYNCIATDASGTWGSVTNSIAVTVTVDNIPPHIATVTPGHDLSTLIVKYSEPVNGADVMGGYSLSGGLAVNSVTSTNTLSDTIAIVKTTAQAPGTNYTLTVSGVTDMAGNALTPTTTNFWSDVLKTGTVAYDAWVDTVNAPQAYTYFAAYPTATSPTPTPGLSTNFSSWEAPGVSVPTSPGGSTVSGVNYGAKMYGWFIPPVTTNYVFFLSADDACRLSLSTNSDPANLCMIAVEDLWSPSDNWTNYASAYPPNTFPPYGAHRGSNANVQNADGGGGFGGPNGAWDPGPDQNRSDEFIAAYTADVVNGEWAATEIGFISDVTGYPTTMPFWPTVDANGNALITLQAGQRYYIQADHDQQQGGADVSVTYKFANNLGDRSNDPGTGTTSIMTGNVIQAMAPFEPTLSIANVGGNLMITYQGILASSPTVNGTYTDIPGAPNPYPVAPNGSAMFFRTHQ